MVDVIDADLADQIGYSGTQAAKVVGISYRQLDYWARTDLIRPSLTDAAGSGSRRRYSYADLLELKTIKKLIDAGIKLEQVRKVFSYLREHVSTDIASAHIVIDGGRVVLCDGDELVDVLKNGQGVLNVLSLGGREGRTRSRPRGRHRHDRWRTRLDVGAPTPDESADVTDGAADFAARRRAPRARRDHGRVRWLGDADRLSVGHDRRTRGLPHVRGDLRRVASRHRAAAGERRLRRHPERADQRPRQDRPRARPVHPSPRRRRRVGARRHHRVVAPRRRRAGVRRDAERLEHRRRARRRGWRRHHRHPCRPRRPGPDGACRSSPPSSRRPPRSAGSRWRGPRGTTCRAPWPAPATPASPASRSPCRPRPRTTLWAAIVAAGVTPAGLGARDTLRLEAGLPLHGHELGPGITSLQAGLGWVVAWDKPSFRGREAARAERATGHRPTAVRARHRWPSAGTRRMRRLDRRRTPSAR